MSIKVQYILFILVLHALLAGMAFYLLRDYKLWLFPVEILLLLSLYLSYRIYNAFTKPLALLSTGIDAIQDQDFNVKFLNTGSLEMDRLIHVYNKMMDHLREERTQAEAQHYFLQKLINASPAGIILLDYDNQITDINPKAREILDLAPQKNTDQLSIPSAQFLKQVMEISEGQSAILTLRTQEQYKCQVSHFIHRGFPRKFLMLQELSREILEAEKRAYGKIIRMMAHEVNNSIGAINSILQSVSEIQPGEDLDVSEYLQVAIERNDRLNQFMRNFAKVIRIPDPQLLSQNLSPLIIEVQKLMAPLARQHDINLQIELAPQPIEVGLDLQLMEQVLVNIIQNSIESIEEKGSIRIRTLAATPTTPTTLLIEDNGQGINPEVQHKLFTPFFSTKVSGQGVGLTLIREILSRHHCIFALQTRPDGWTEFKIEFPGKQSFAL